ncbi:hypothetical protein VTK56DRAFT_2723 [Thermocarpiscus australiensis]
MLFPEEHAAHLKKWIVKRLENTSDADADVLADYVLALLRHDGSVSDVRKLCEEEIPDFLKEDSSVFVNDVFEAIAYRSYLPGAPPPPSKTASLPAPAAAQPPPGLPYGHVPRPSVAGYPPPFQNGSRKRAYNDWDDPNNQNGRDAGFGGRTFKQPRRGAFGGRGGRQDDVNPFSAAAPTIPPYLPSGHLPPQNPPAPSTVGYFDPTGAMDTMYGMSLATGHPMPEFLSQTQRQPPKKRARCRDWERKGYCQRGSNCMFEHSNDPVGPPPPGHLFGSMQPVPQHQVVDEYDPKNALMTNLFNPPGLLQGQQPSVADVSQQPRQKGGRPIRQKRGEKAPFSADGPVYDRTKSTIVVENIPEENFSEEQVRGFFSQFGKIVEVSMQPYKRLAIVKFDSWGSANAAYQSPKVIFDNRFVKVFWYKEDESALPASGPLTVSTPDPMRHTNGSPAGANSSGPKADIDIEDFLKKQEERQKAFEEKAKKREEVERRLQELEKRQKELIAKHLEEKARLEAKLAQRNGANSGGSEGGKEDGSTPSKPTSQTEALRAQLAALEAEARQMGLDPDAMSDAPAPWPAKGGTYGYGRGRGGWRGGSYTPRGGYRGGYRGRADVHAAYAAYSIDNRPKKVVLTGVDFTVSEKDETLRQYLFGIGEFTGIQTTSSSAEVTFKDRKTAEKFFNSVLRNNKEIPGIEGTVELSWAASNGTSGSVPTTPGPSGNIINNNNNSLSTPGVTNTGISSSAGGASGGGGGGVSSARSTAPKRDKATGMGADDAAGSSSDKDVHILLERPPDQNEMDYEVADENQWGYY